MFKIVTSAAVTGGMMLHQYQKHSQPQVAPQSSINSFGNDKIHAMHQRQIDIHNNYSLKDKIAANLSGRGKVLTDLFTKGELPAHDSIAKHKEHIADLVEFSQTGNAEQLDKTSFAKAYASDVKENLPTRFYQAVTGVRTATSVTPEGMQELKSTIDKSVENVMDVAMLGTAVGLAGNTALTVAKVIVPGAAIPITVAQVAWAATSVGKTVSQIDSTVKEHVENSPLQRHARENLLKQVHDINNENRIKRINPPPPSSFTGGA